MLIRLDTVGGRDVCFACARSADKHDISCFDDGLASVQLADRRFVTMSAVSRSPLLRGSIWSSGPSVGAKQLAITKMAHHYGMHRASAGVPSAQR